MAHIMPTLAKMITLGKVPNRGGVWIDIYNQITNAEIAGVIHTRISHGNYWYVTEEYETDRNEISHTE